MVHESCSSCRAKIPVGAQFCPSCGVSQAQEAWDECVVTWWRGYMFGQFVAVRTGTVDWEEIGKSKSFRWLHAAAVPPQRRRVLSRLAALTKKLEEQGWEQFDEGPDWYQFRFRRPLAPTRKPAVAKIVTEAAPPLR